MKGIEVVLPNGEVVTLGGKLYKDNVGYSLKDLIVGSEGTLGIVTKVILRLKPSSQKPRYVLVPFTSREDAIEAIPAILQKAGFIPLGCEYLEKHALELGEENIGEAWPAEKGEASLMIAIAGGSEKEILEKAQKVMEICEAKGAIDTFLAIEDREIDKVTKVRLGVGQAPLELEGRTMFFQSDMVVPPSKVPMYLNKIDKIIEESPLDIEKIFFGHAADGNLHTELAWPKDAPKDEVLKVKHKMMQLARDMGGSLSGEHGIGLVKRKDFRRFYQDEVLRLNDAIKEVFDPNHILNPGKVVGEVTDKEEKYLEM